MQRWACVDVLAFPLQIVLQDHPDWVGLPAAVVDRNKPQGVIQWANEPARRSGVLPGMRFAAALALVPELRADVSDVDRLGSAIDELVELLLRHSPQVEPAADEPGVFWLDACGLERLSGSMQHWADDVNRDLDAAGFFARVVVGFSRFGSYAVARGASRRTTVFGAPEQELAAARLVPLARLRLAPGFRDALARLGVRTVGQLVSLPPAGIRPPLRSPGASPRAAGS